MKLKKSELKEKLRNLFIREWVESNSLDFFKTMPKKELKNYINLNGWFTKWKIQKLEFNGESVKSDDQKVPDGAFYFEAILSDESLNMNWYRILLQAWNEWFGAYFSDFEWLNYLMHDMDLPIGKTLEIGVDEEAKNLRAKGFAYDDLTEKRVSRGLVRDISTGHIPLEIKYINKDTNEEKTPNEFFDMLWEMVSRMFDEWKDWDTIEQAIADLRDLRVETHTKVQIVEYSFVSVGANKQAEVKKINNTVEKLATAELNEVEIEDEEPVTTEDKPEDKEIPSGTTETPVATDEWKDDDTTPADGKQPTTTTTENNLEDAGETPKGSEDKPEVPENGEATDEVPQEKTPEELKVENETLTAENLQLKEKVTTLEADKTKLENDVQELTAFNNSRKKIAVNSMWSESNKEEDTKKQIAINCVRLLNPTH